MEQEEQSRSAAGHRSRERQQPTRSTRDSQLSDALAKQGKEIPAAVQNPANAESLDKSSSAQ